MGWLDQLIVHAVAPSIAPKLISAGIGSAVGAGLRGASSGGTGGGGAPATPAPTTTFGNKPGSTYTPPPTVDGVTVNGSGAPSALGTGLAPAGLAGAATRALTGNAGTDTLTSPVVVNGQPANANADPNAVPSAAGSAAAGALDQALSRSQDTTVDGVNVVGTRAPPLDSATPAAFTAIPSNLLTLNPGELSTPPAQTTPLSPTDLLGIAALGGGAGLLAGSGGITPTNLPDPSTLNTDPSLQYKLDPKTLLPLAPLVPLLGGGTGTGVGGASDALKGVADNANNLSNRLGGIANAGMAGDIGGRGLNTINRMVRNAQAAIRQRYASMGMSGSTAEDDDLNAAAQAGVDQQFKIGQDMAKTALTSIAALTGQSAAIYTSLLNAATAKDTALGNALANFAAAVAK